MYVLKAYIQHSIIYLRYFLSPNYHYVSLFLHLNLRNYTRAEYFLDFCWMLSIKLARKTRWDLATVILSFMLQSKLMKFPTKEDLGCVVLYKVIYSMLGLNWCWLLSHLPPFPLWEKEGKAERSSSAQTTSNSFYNVTNMTLLC